jgi:hypothetical protein
MRLLILYRPDSGHSRAVEEFVRDFEKQHPGHRVVTESLNTRDGAASASLYDVTAYPAILALAEDSQILKLWQGEQLPLMNEVAAYVNS